MHLLVSELYRLLESLLFIGDNNVWAIALMKKINHFTDVICVGPKFISKYFVFKYL